jgi:uncharacterized damage-inducible protein DinB
MNYRELIDEYLAGCEQIERAVAGMSDIQIDARPIPGKWSTRQVVCHIADFEPIYADRMKRVIAERCPTFFGGDPDIFAAALAYEKRSVAQEICLIVAVRQHVASILRELRADDFARTGNHSEAGPMTLENLLQNITQHIPHHVRFIHEKRAALKIG